MMEPELDCPVCVHSMRLVFWEVDAGPDHVCSGCQITHWGKGIDRWAADNKQFSEDEFPRWLKLRSFQ